MNKKGRIITTICIVAILLSVLGTTIAFSALATTLNILGTASIDPASWNIHFTTLTSPIITGNAEVITAPVLNNTAIGSFNIKLTKPGDSVTYTFYVENTGSMDAKIGTFIAPLGPLCTGTGENATADAIIVCENLTYSIVYIDDGNIVQSGDILQKGQVNRKQIKLKIMYNSGDQLPNNKVEISGLNFSIIYVEN